MTTYQGAPPVGALPPRDAVASATVIAPRDRVRWGPVIAGLVTTLGSFLLMSTLALALGLQVAPRGTDADDAGIAAGLATGAIGLISFFLGGFVAARSSAVEGASNGILNGFLVWAVAVGFVLILAALGVGALFGATGDLFDQYRSLGSASAGVDVETVREQVRNGALGAFLGLALPALAAMVGGWLGARDDVFSQSLRPVRGQTADGGPLTSTRS